jgi:hypothetical protein
MAVAMINNRSSFTQGLGDGRIDDQPAGDRSSNVSHVASNLPAVAPPRIVARNERGQILPGYGGPGRKPGSKNKHTENLIAAVTQAFAEYGPEALKRLAEADPYGFLKFSRSIIPPELIRNVFNRPDVAYEDLSDEEVLELMKAEERRREVLDKLRQVRGLTPLVEDKG